MKVLPLDHGPIVGATTSTSVRLWGRAPYEPTPDGPRRAFGVGRHKPESPKKGRRRFHAPVFFKMNPNFGMTGVVVLFWPYPEAPARAFELEGTLRAGEYAFELAEAGPVHSTDNFIRVTVHSDGIEAQTFSRKGELLSPMKTHFL